MKITDSPGAMLVTPFKARADPNEFELSSTFHPAMFAAAVPTFVTSNQSSPTGLLPLDHGATSEMIRLAVPPVEAVTARTRLPLASGALLPTAGSATLTVTP